MTAVVSDTMRLSDTAKGCKRLQISVASRLPDPTDAEIRNKVEGYRTEAEVTADAEQSFDIWWSKIDVTSRLGLDGFSLWRAYKAGWLSMAREVGQLPSKGAA